MGIALCSRWSLWQKNKMEEPKRDIDRKKILGGVFFICLAVLLMLLGEKYPSSTLQGIWVSLLGLGLSLYLWGRFFSRGGD